MHLKKSIVFWLALGAGPASSYVGSIARADVVLQISRVDHHAILPERVWAQRVWLGRLYPGARVLRVTVTAPRPEAQTDASVARVADEVRAGLRALDLRGDRVRLLILNGHGAGGDHFGGLEELGEFYAAGPGPKFREVFGSLRGRFARDARVVLLGCDTFAGERSRVIARAEALMRYFDIPEGSIFGFTTKAGGPPRWRAGRPTLTEAARAIGAALIPVLPLAVHSAPQGVVQAYAMLTSVLFGEIFVLKLRRHRRDYRTALRDGEINRGHRLELRGGRVVRATELVYGSHTREIYGCADRLERNHSARDARGDSHR